MALKDWKKSKHHATANTKIAWESKDEDTIEIRHVKDSSIPYKLILNGYKEVDSTGTIKKAKKLASNWRRKH